MCCTLYTPWSRNQNIKTEPGPYHVLNLMFVKVSTLHSYNHKLTLYIPSSGQTWNCTTYCRSRTHFHSDHIFSSACSHQKKCTQIKMSHCTLNSSFKCYTHHMVALCVATAARHKLTLSVLLILMKLPTTRLFVQQYYTLLQQPLRRFFSFCSSVWLNNQIYKGAGQDITSHRTPYARGRTTMKWGHENTAEMQIMQCHEEHPSFKSNWK